MGYPDSPGNSGGSWSGQPAWSSGADQPWQQPPAPPTSPYPPPQYATPYSAAAPATSPTTPAARRGGAAAGAALSFVTAVSMAVLGTVAMIAVVAASALTSTLGSVTSAYGSYGTTTGGSRASGEGIAVVVIALGLAFVLFWGGLLAALGRGVGAAVAGNVVAVLLVVIGATQSSGYVMLLAIVPVLAILVLAAGRNATTG